MLGVQSEDELLTTGPRFMGVPKVKSAFAFSTAMLDNTTNTSEIVFFILFSFQDLLIFSGHTLCVVFYDNYFYKEPFLRAYWPYSY
jgi:hypothetical protein